MQSDKEHYFDNAATTVVCEEAIEAAVRVMSGLYGNPGSVHAKGREARKIVEYSRCKTADALGCVPEEIFFTSCGSESDNWAIINGAESMKIHGKHIISSNAEHDAVRKSLDELEERGFSVTRINPDSNGVISKEKVLSVLRPDTILISLMLVNNETGSITNISDISNAVREEGSSAVIHTDAIQAFMKIPVIASQLSVDMISLSGHKIHAPKGIGVLYIRKGLNLKPYIFGGGQENGLRSGTEAVPQIAAMGEAISVAKAGFIENSKKMSYMRAEITRRIRQSIPSVCVNGGGAPHILNISIPGIPSEQMMVILDAKGIYVSQSSACKKGAKSHVLKAMGLSEDIIGSALRISLSRFTTDEDVEALCSGIIFAYNTLKSIPINY